jgi:hypothetical protein
MKEKPVRGARAIGGEAVLAATGRSFEGWALVLRRHDARMKDGTSRARHLREAYHLSSWWARMIVARFEWDCGVRPTRRRRGR